MTPSTFASLLAPYQREGVEFALENPRSLILDPPGLGKTHQALGLIDALYRRPRTGPFRVAVMVDSDALARQWLAHLAEHFPEIPAIRLAGTKASREFQQNADGPVIVVTTYRMAGSGKESVGGLLTHPKFRWSLVVMDEVSELRGGGADQKAAKKVGLNADRVLGLTATIMENAGTDTWYILDAVRTPGLWAREVFEFQFIEWLPAFTTPSGQYIPAKAIGLKPDRLPEFGAYLYRYSKASTELEAGITLPRRVGEQVLWVQPSLEQAHQLTSAERIKNPRVKQARLERACDSPAGASAKVATTLRWLAANPQHRKVIIYSRLEAALDAAAAGLEAEGVGFVRVDGKVTQTKRAPLIDEFNDDPSIRVMLGSEVIERGLDGLKNASALLSLGCSWNPAREEQREGRLRRRGSPNETYEHLAILIDHWFERKRWSDLARKRSQAQDLRDERLRNEDDA